MANTTHLDLPLMSAAQNQKHITHNDAIIKLDAIVQLTVISMNLSAPPASPTEGDRYVIGSSATGAWASKDLNIVYYSNGAWVFIVPRKGWLIWDENTSDIYVWSGTEWESYANTKKLLTLANLSDGYTVKSLGVGGAPDTYNRLVVHTKSALFNAETDSINVSLNKTNSGSEAGFTLQTNYSPRALFGLRSNDDFTITLTPDGSTFHNALIAHTDTAAVSLPAHPKFSGYCNYDKYNAANTWFKLDINNVRHNDQASFSSATFKAPHNGYYMFGYGGELKVNNSNPPTKFAIGLSVNGANPNNDALNETGEGSAALDDFTNVNGTAMLKLSTGDTVEMMGFFTTNDGFIKANNNYFWGCQIA